MKNVCFIVLACFLSIGASAQIQITEILPGNVVELYNNSENIIDVSGFWLCDFPTYDQVGDFDIICGSYMMMPGDVLVICGWNIDPNDSELGLYSTNSFSSSAAMVDYVEWGSSGHQRSSVAVNAGVWTTGNFIAPLVDGMSAQRTEQDNITSDAWHEVPPQICRAFVVDPGTSNLCPSDINSSGTTDSADLLILLGQFGGVCNEP